MLLWLILGMSRHWNLVQCSVVLCNVVSRRVGSTRIWVIIKLSYFEYRIGVGQVVLIGSFLFVSVFLGLSTWLHPMCPNLTKFVARVDCGTYTQLKLQNTICYSNKFPSVLMNPKCGTQGYPSNYDVSHPNLPYINPWERTTKIPTI